MHLCAQHNVFRPDVQNVHAELNSWGGLIVHFSGVPAGVAFNSRKTFPGDLRDVIEGRAQHGISCSTVRPGDDFESFNQRNAWGCIGVVVRGRTPWSLVDVDLHDCGSSVPIGETERTSRRCNADLDMYAVRESLLGRSPGDCNEWVMRDYQVLGLLVQRPFNVVDVGRVASREEILEAAGNLPMYTLNRGGLFQLDREFRLTQQVVTSSLYP